MKIGQETIIHCKITNWLKQCTKLKFYHFPNEGKRTFINADILHRMGMVPGVYDLFLPKGNHLFKGFWLEVKTLKGKMSPTQIEFGNDMIEEGYQALTCYSEDEGILMIKRFYNIT